MFNVIVHSDKMVEVGPVFLAKNGVCYLGDWSGLSKKVSDEIKICECEIRWKYISKLVGITNSKFSVIDSGRYFINETSESVKLGSALWTYWSLAKNRKDFSQVAVFMK